jgi:hypothetical protein
VAVPPRGLKVTVWVGVIPSGVSWGYPWIGFRWGYPLGGVSLGYPWIGFLGVIPSGVSLGYPWIGFLGVIPRGCLGVILGLASVGVIPSGVSLGLSLDWHPLGLSPREVPLGYPLGGVFGLHLDIADTEHADLAGIVG